MKYTKLEAPLKERLIFLFTGLLSDKLYDKWKCVLETDNTTKPILIESRETPKQEENININNKEEIKMDIPFFDLDTSETKSNL